MWYTDWDDEEQMYGVFHVDTGFCKGLFCELADAENYANQLNGDN